MYSDAEAKEPPHDESKEQEGADAKGQEYPLPKAVLEGKDFSVGDEVVLRITAIHDDQIFVTYAPAKEQESGKDKGDMGGEGAMGGKGGDQEYASMME